MSTGLKTLAICLCGLLGLASHAFAGGDPIGPLHEEQIVKMLRWQGMDTNSIAHVISSLKKDPKSQKILDAGAPAQNTPAAPPLEVGSVLFSHGLSGALFSDTSSWNFTAAVNYNNKLYKIRDLFEITYKNGGLKAEFVYKWIWIFLPKGIPLDLLDGATFGDQLLGRGIALSWSVFQQSPAQIEGGWVSMKDGMTSAYILALKVGISASNLMGMALPKTGLKASIISEIMFPQLTLKQKVLLPFSSAKP